MSDDTLAGLLDSELKCTFNQVDGAKVEAGVVVGNDTTVHGIVTVPRVAGRKDWAVVQSKHGHLYLNPDIGRCYVWE